MSKSRVLIFGAGGMLGRDVVDVFSVSHEVFATDLKNVNGSIQLCDGANLAQVKKVCKSFRPDMVINLAAQTSLEFCESNPSIAWRDNVLSCEVTLSEARKLGIPYVFISTAGIFDGLLREYTEYSTPNPLSIYGKSKMFSESLVSTYDNGFVVRAGWMMGGGIKDHKFVSLIVRQIILDSSKVIHAVDDKYGTPTYTRDFARGLVQIIDSAPPGLYHQVCHGSASRYEVAQEIARYFGPEIKVNSVNSEFFEKTYFASRPKSEQLINFKLQNLGLDVMNHWKISLQEYLPGLVEEICIRNGVKVFEPPAGIEPTTFALRGRRSTD